METKPQLDYDAEFDSMMQDPSSLGNIQEGPLVITAFESHATDPAIAPIFKGNGDGDEKEDTGSLKSTPQKDGGVVSDKD